MKRFLAVVMSLTLGALTIAAQAQEHRGRGNRGNNENHQQQELSRGGDRQSGGWNREQGNVVSATPQPFTVQPALAQGNRSDDRGHDDRRGGDNNRRGNDSRGWSDNNHHGDNNHRGWSNNGGNNRSWDRNDHRWDQRGWNRNDWRRSWNHGWSGSRYRSTSRYSYPRGFTARHWTIGTRLPAVFYAASYYLNYSSYGLAPPPWGCRWVRVDSNVLLVDLTTGEVLDVLYNFYYR